MTVLQFLKDFPYLPMILGKDGRYERPSNSLIKNWVSQRVVLINGTSELRADDELQFPLEQFIIFPKKKAQRRAFLLPRFGILKKSLNSLKQKNYLEP